MTIEAFKEAENILEKLKRIDSILEVLNSVKACNLQRKDLVAEEDLTTTLTLWIDDSEHLRGDNTPFPELHLTYEHIEVMKQAFENQKVKLNTKFSMM